MLNSQIKHYLQNFHFQTDGYLSEASAELYDYQVEVLFSGGAQKILAGFPKSYWVANSNRMGGAFPWA